MGCLKIGKGKGLVQAVCNKIHAHQTPLGYILFQVPLIDETHEALFHLEDALLRHGTNVEGSVGQGVGRSKTGPSRAGPSHIESKEVSTPYQN